jgi:hypothetical protein
MTSNGTALAPTSGEVHTMVSRTTFSIVTCGALVAGCGWGVQATAPSADVQMTSAEVDTAPVDIESSPQVVYEGRPTYFYQNQWYYQDSGHWRTYRSEPSGLAEHRRQFEVQRQAPRREEQSRQTEPQRQEQVRQAPRQEQQNQVQQQRRPQQQQTQQRRNDQRKR